MQPQQAHQVKRFLTHTASWMLFLVLSLAVMIVSLSRLDALGPAGVAHSVSPRSSGGAVGFTIGPSPTVTARAAYVFDADLGFAYYAKDADEELPMASCTKIMTALLAVEHSPLDRMITVGPDAAALVRPDSSFMGLTAGQQLTLNDLLYGLVLPSGNDAAVAIADAIGGSESNFVAMMNARAKELGLAHTHFMNPHGLGEDGHYTTARDLAVLAGVAMKHPELVKVTSTAHYTIPQTATHAAYDLHTGIDIIPGSLAPYPGAIGVKPGYTGDAGYCEAFAAVRRGHMIVGVLLNEPTWQIRMADMRTLLDWGFAQEGIGPAPPPTPGSDPSGDL